MKLWITLALAVIFLTGTALAQNCTLPDSLKPTLLKAWDIARPQLKQQVEQGLAEQNPNALYNLELYTHPLINAARDCQLRTQLDQLCSLYGLAFQGVQPAVDARGNSFQGWLCGSAKCPSYPKSGHPAPFEVLLYSGQFLYASSALINAVSQVPAGDRSASMNALLAQAPYIASTYLRWIYSGVDGSYPAGIYAGTQTLLKGSFRSDDKPLTVAGGVVELLDASKRESGGLGISSDQRAKLTSYAELYWELIMSRSHFDKSGRLAYDEAWGGIDRNRGASWTSLSKPTADEASGTRNRLSMDISHFARIPEVMDSYQRTGYADAGKYLQGVATEFTDRVWNGDRSNPRFYNYFSGDDIRGWYNLTFDKRGKAIGEGNAPGSLSSKGPAYFWLGKYNSRMKQLSWDYYKANSDKFELGQGAELRRVLYILESLPNFVAQ